MRACGKKDCLSFLLLHALSNAYYCCVLCICGAVALAAAAAAAGRRAGRKEQEWRDARGRPLRVILARCRYSAFVAHIYSDCICNLFHYAHWFVLYGFQEI